MWNNQQNSVVRKPYEKSHSGDLIAVVRGQSRGESIISKVTYSFTKNGHKDLLLHLPKDSVNLFAVGDRVAIYKRTGQSDTENELSLRIRKIEFPKIVGAEPLHIHKINVHNSSQRIFFRGEADILGVGERAKLLLESDAGAVGVIVSREERKRQPQGILHETGSYSSGSLYMPKTIMADKFGEAMFAATYKLEDDRILTMPVVLPKCDGTFLRDSSIFASNQSGHRLFLLESDGVSAGDYVKVKEDNNALIIDKVPKSAIELPEHTLKGVFRVHFDEPRNSESIVIPKEVAENCELNKGEWVKLRVNNKGNLEIRKLEMHNEEGIELVRISKVSKRDNLLRIIIPKRIEKSMNLAAGDEMKVYLQKKKGKAVVIMTTEEGADTGYMEGARLLETVVLLRHSSKITVAPLPDKVERKGFGKGVYVLVKADAQRHLIILENAGLEEREIPAKPHKEIDGSWCVTLKRDLPGFVRGGNVVIWVPNEKERIPGPDYPASNKQ